MSNFHEQIAKLTPEQRAEVVRGINEAFDGIAVRFREVAAGLQAAFQTIQRLSAMGADESPGLVWSELMAQIDELAEVRPVVVPTGEDTATDDH